MSGGEILILGAVTAFGGSIVLKIETIHRPDNVTEAVAASIISIAGIVLTLVGIFKVL